MQYLLEKYLCFFTVYIKAITVHYYKINKKACKDHQIPAG